MLFDFIFILILLGLIYSYTTSQNQFSATASAIRQIWSGSCRLSCRQSGYSGISGLSGLPSPSPRNQIITRGSIAGPSRDCNCESCPCGLIENFIRTCQPATNIYTLLVNCISICVSFFLQRVEDAYDYLIRVSECNITCQRQPQLISTRDYCDSNENFSFGRGDKEKIDKIREKSQISESIEQYSRTLDGDTASRNNDESESKRQEGIENRKTDVDFVREKLQIADNVPERNRTQDVNAVSLENSSALQEGTSKDSKGPNVEKLSSLNASKIQESSEESMAEKGFCAKCIEKGRTCLKQCPRAAKRK